MKRIKSGRKFRNIDVKTALLFALREFGTSVVALATLLVAITTLYTYDGHLLRQSRWNISLNVLLSIYATITKIALTSIIASGLGRLTWIWFKTDRPVYDLAAFDQASRGMLGSLYLLWRVKFHQVLVSFGALLAVALLALDPFVQQLLHYKDCHEVVDDQGFLVPIINGRTMPAFNDFAVHSGLWSSPYTFTPVCVTGSCSMPQEYWSVAFCSACHDISDRIQFEEYEFTNTSFIPGGASINYTVGDPSVTLATMSQTGYSMQILVNSRPFDHLRTSFPNLSTILRGCDNTNGYGEWSCRGYGAAECITYPCIKPYTASVTAGKFTENTVDVFPANLTWGLHQGDNTSSDASEGRNDHLARRLMNGYHWLIDIPCLSKAQQQQIAQLGHTISAEQKWFWLDDITRIADAQIPLIESLSPCLYLLHSIAISQRFPDQFTGDLKFEADLPGTLSFNFNQPPDLLRAILAYYKLEFDVVSGIFENVSSSLTNFYRIHQPSRSFARGSVLKQDTCLDIEWKWATFSVSIVIMCVVFYVLVVIHTKTIESDIWKSAPLAMIFHGPFSDVLSSGWSRTNEIGHGNVDDDGVLHNTKSFETAAKQLIVRLDDKGEKLVASETQIRQATEYGAKALSWFSSLRRRRRQNTTIS